MWSTPRRLFTAVTDITIGTAIVMIQLVIADRIRTQEMQRALPARGSGDPGNHVAPSAPRVRTTRSQAQSTYAP